MSRLPVLEEIRIATPCTASWDEMQGDDRVRHCAHCDLDVFNLSGMTRGDAQALLDARLGRVCVRLYKRHDGTVITQDCPTALSRARRRLAAAAVFAITMVGVAIEGIAGVRWLTARQCAIDPSAEAGSVTMQSPTLEAIAAMFSGKPATPVPPPVVMMGTPVPMPIQTPGRGGTP